MEAAGGDVEGGIFYDYGRERAGQATNSVFCAGIICLLRLLCNRHAKLNRLIIWVLLPEAALMVGLNLRSDTR